MTARARSDLGSSVVPALVPGATAGWPQVTTASMSRPRLVASGSILDFWGSAAANSITRDRGAGRLPTGSQFMPVAFATSTSYNGRHAKCTSLFSIFHHDRVDVHGGPG